MRASTNPIILKRFLAATVLTAVLVPFRGVSAQSASLAQDPAFVVPAEAQRQGVGVSTFDHNRDGWPDITLALRPGPPAIFQATGAGQFIDISDRFELPDSGYTMMTLWGYANADRVPDLLIARENGGGTRLLVGQSDGYWRDETELYGLDPAWPTVGGAFGDYNADGYLDLYLTLRGQHNVLLRNDGGAGFVDETGIKGVAGIPESLPMQSGWIDYDLDGDLDLFVTHDLDVRSLLFRNDGEGLWTETGDATGFSYIGPGNSMGVAWGDPNLDGYPDAYITRIEFGGLYMNNGDATFSDEAPSLGAETNGVSWGTMFSDVDNDGDEDLFIASASSWQNRPPLLWMNEAGFFVDAGLEYMPTSKGAAAADFDQDGGVDMLVAAGSGDHTLFRNEMPGRGSWLQVGLDGPNGNAAGIGASVVIRTQQGTQVRRVSGGDSYLSQSSDIVHFGLGHETMVDTITVYWPDGEVVTQAAVAANQTIRLVHPAIASSVGTDELAPISTCESYPNPTRGIINLSSGWAEDIRVTDMLGRVHKARALGRDALDLSGLAQGPYVVQAGTCTRLILKVD